jgi:hydroxymethylbilane synthase
VASELKRLFGLEVEIQRIKTTGDKILDSPLAKIGGKGLFVKEIEKALEQGQIDLAVHSMKDVPTELPKGLMIGAVTKREDPRDVLVSRDKVSLMDLPKEAKVGTSSLRRKAQLWQRRPDFNMVDVRGNLDTRLRKMKEGQFDAMVLARAGLKRMGFEEAVTEVLEPQVMLPAVGQGALAIEVREDDEMVREMVKALNHLPTQQSILAERALMRRLEGGCQVPVGALGIVKNGQVSLKAMVASLDGRKMVRDEVAGPSQQAEKLGVELAEKLLNQGADAILAEVRSLPDEP